MSDRPTQNGDTSEPPRLHAICVVQNEFDVIGESVRWAARFCDQVTVWDLGSYDGTTELLKGFDLPNVQVSLCPDVPYSKGIRGQMLEDLRPSLPEGSWLYVLDADEFVVGDPKPLLRRAAAAGAHIVRAWHMNFYPTPSDLARIDEMGDEAWAAIPLFDRLRWYQAEWKERRFLRITDDFSWTERDGRSKMELRDGRKPHVYRRSAMIRHYRYRGPRQVAHRYGTRQTIRTEGYNGFRYDETASLADYARPERACRRWPDGDAVPRISAAEIWKFESFRLRVKLRKLLDRPRGAS
ncbi:MAG: glycosyltransferase family 2 protein [Myxococcota bacterium]